MEVRETRSRLRELLAKSGFQYDPADPGLGWKIFKAFLQEPVQCADDSGAVSVRFINASDGKNISLKLQRAFEIIDSEKYFVTTVSLALDFRTQVDDLNTVRTMSLSTVGFRRIDAFVAAVDSDPVFQATLLRSPWTCALTAWAPKGQEEWLGNS